MASLIDTSTPPHLVATSSAAAKIAAAIGDIEGEDHCRAAKLFYFVSHLFQRLAVARDQRDGPATAGEAVNGRTPNSCGCASNDYSSAKSST